MTCPSLQQWISLGNYVAKNLWSNFRSFKEITVLGVHMMGARKGSLLFIVLIFGSSHM